MFKLPSILKLEQLINAEFQQVGDEEKLFNTRNSFLLDEQGNVVGLNAVENDLLNLRGFYLFKKLEILKIRYNHLEDISTLGTFKRLKTLDVCGNRIVDISPLHSLKMLEVLILDHNKIVDFTPAMVGIAFGKIRELSLKENGVDLPSRLTIDERSFAVEFLQERNAHAQLLIANNLQTRETILDLGRTGITNLELLPKLFNCEHLEELILSNEWGEHKGEEWTLSESKNDGPVNNIYHIPKAIKNLKNLKKLICGGDWHPKKEGISWNRWRISDFTPFLEMEKLTFLNASNNLISKISQLDRLSNLQQLHLNNNMIRAVRLDNLLPNLRVFFLSSNLLSSVEFLQEMPGLTTLDLHSNRIKDMLPAKSLIQKIGIKDSKWEFGTLSIRNNITLMFPSTSVIKRGVNSVLAYFDQLEAERAANIKPSKNRDAKLILVGNSNVGKSSLSEYLRTGKTDKDIKSTHWLEIKLWQVKIGTRNVNFRIFDFGGQEYYHDTHHIFFTKRTAYILLWDRFTNEYSEQNITQRQIDGEEATMPIQGYPVIYWLNSIRYHCDKRTVHEGEKQIAELQANRDIKNLEPIELKSDKKDAGAQAKLDEDDKEVKANILVIQNKVDSQSDIRYLDFEKMKVDHPEIYGTTAISINEKRGLNQFKELLAELLENMPIFEEDILATWGLVKNILVNEPQRFQSHLTSKEFQKFCNQEIKKSEKFKDLPTKTLKTLLFDESGISSLAQYLNDIGVLLYFPENESLSDKVLVNQDRIINNIYKVLFKLSDLNGKFDHEYVVKKLDKRRFDDEADTLVKLMIQFKIIFKHPSRANTYIAPLYLPKKPLKAVQLFLNAFQKPAYRFQFNTYIHKHIVLEFFQEYGANALSDDASLEGYYYWRDGLVIKDHLTNEIVLVRFFNGNEEKMDCYIDLYRLHESKDKTFLNKIASDLERIYEDPSILRSVTLNGEDFVPIKILQDAEQKKEYVFKYGTSYYNLIDFSEYISTKFKMKKIFISYSKADYLHLQKLENHLSVLKRNGNISTWNCRKLLPGEKWDGKIKNELEEADIILFLVSDDFLATDYIWDIEIKRAIEREEEGTATVVPIIVRSCMWEDSPLGVYTTAPGKALVISTAPDIDTAWTEAVRNLAKIF